MMSIIGARNTVASLKLCNSTARCILSHTNRNVLSVKSLHQAVLATSKCLLQKNQAQRLLIKDLKYFAPFTRLISYGPKGQLYIPLLRSGHRVTFVRFSSDGREAYKDSTTLVIYISSLLIVMLGLTYAAVPAYKVFCRQFGLGGNTEYSRALNSERVASMQKIEERVIKIRFTADTAAAMTWKFKPQQSEIMVVPGETALAFYSATNPTERPVIGISTYSVSPPTAALYFNKIQCFCFEEQILNPGEQVDLPVFFYIDPDYDEDLELEFTDEITLSYTFFEAREGLNLPLPGFVTKQFEESSPQTT